MNDNAEWLRLQEALTLSQQNSQKLRDAVAQIKCTAKIALSDKKRVAGLKVIFERCNEALGIGRSFKGRLVDNHNDATLEHVQAERDKYREALETITFFEEDTGCFQCEEMIRTAKQALEVRER